MRCGCRPNEIGFTGWTGLCDVCVRFGFVLPVVPDEWKQLYTDNSAAVMVITDDPPPTTSTAAKVRRQRRRDDYSSGAGSSKDCAIFVLDDTLTTTTITTTDDQRTDAAEVAPPPPPKSARELIKEREEIPLLPDHWKISDDGHDARRKLLVKIFDRGENPPIIDPEYGPEILRVLDAFEKSVESQQRERDTIPPDFNVLSTLPLFTISTIERNQNYSLLRYYDAALGELKVANDARGSQDRAEVIEDTIAFHGTKYEYAVDIATNGPLTAENKFGIYGWGFYLSRQKLNIPLNYAFRHMADTPTLVFGRCLVGRNSPTIKFQNRPNPGDDTGGYGNAYIHVVFQNTHFLPEYLITVQPATSTTDWGRQVEAIKQSLLQGSAAASSAQVAAPDPPVVAAPPPLPAVSPAVAPPPPPSSPPPPLPPPQATGGGGGPRCTCPNCSRLAMTRASAPAAAIPDPSASSASPGGSSSSKAAKRRKPKRLRFTPRRRSSSSSPSRTGVAGGGSSPTSSRYKPDPSSSSSSSSDDSGDDSDPSYKPSPSSAGGGGGSGGVRSSRV